MLRPEQFGAVGNGIHDDTLAFQNALAALQASQTLFLSPKVYCISRVIVDPPGQWIGRTIAGDYDGSGYIAGSIPTLKCTGDGLVFGSIPRSCTIKGIFFTGNGTGRAIATDCIPGRGGSKDWTIKRCGFSGFKIPLMHNDTPWGTGLLVPQGDGYYAHRCYIQNCEYGFCTGQSQSRNTVLSNMQINNVGTCIDNMTFGSGNGTPPSVEYGQFNGCERLFNVGTGIGPFSVRNLYAEDCTSIGTIASMASVNNQPAELSLCDINLRDTPNPAITFGTDVSYSGRLKTDAKSLVFKEANNSPPVWPYPAPTLFFEKTGLWHTGPDAEAGLIYTPGRVEFGRQCTIYDPKTLSSNIMRRLQ